MLWNCFLTIEKRFHSSRTFHQATTHNSPKNNQSQQQLHMLPIVRPTSCTRSSAVCKQTGVQLRHAVRQPQALQLTRRSNALTHISKQSTRLLSTATSSAGKSTPDQAYAAATAEALAKKGAARMSARTLFLLVLIPSQYLPCYSYNETRTHSLSPHTHIYSETGESSLVQNGRHSRSKVRGTEGMGGYNGWQSAHDTTGMHVFTNTLFLFTYTPHILHRYSVLALPHSRSSLTHTHATLYHTPHTHSLHLTHLPAILCCLGKQILCT